MNLRESWENFWFEPTPPNTVALYRILHGLLVLEYCALIAPDLMVWFGNRGVLTPATSQTWMTAPCINLLTWVPDDRFVYFLFATLVLSAICLILGLFTRASSVILFLCLVSFHHRNSLIINSGDVLLRLNSFYLMFSQAGAAYSLDRIIEVWRAKKPPSSHQWFPGRPWAQRLMQFQLAAVYCHAFWTKLPGHSWLDGTALYYVLHDPEFLRFPVPFVPEIPLLYTALSWGTIVLEGLLWTLIWFRPFRYYLLIGAVFLHAGIDYSMNLPVFQWLMIASLINFVYPQDLDSWIDKLKQRLRMWLDSKESRLKGSAPRSDTDTATTLLFDGRNERSARLIETLRRLDFLETLQYFDIRHRTGKEHLPAWDKETAQHDVFVLQNNQHWQPLHEALPGMIGKQPWFAIMVVVMAIVDM